MDSGNEKVYNGSDDQEVDMRKFAVVLILLGLVGLSVGISVPLSKSSSHAPVTISGSGIIAVELTEND